MRTDRAYTGSKQLVLAVSLELAAAKWKVTLHDGRREKPAVHMVAQPQAVLDAIEQQKLKWSQPGGTRVVVSYEAGQDAFWLSVAITATRPAPNHPFGTIGAGVSYWLSLPKSRQSVCAS